MSNRRIIDQATFPTTTAGMARAQTWIGRRTNGEIDTVLIAAEGTGNYGAVAAGRFEHAGYRAVEAPTPSVKRLRDNGKTDALDAVTAARSTIVTDLDDLRDRRRDQIRAALNILTVARDQMATERTRTVNALTALIKSYDLGIDARRALSAARISEVCSRRRRDEPIGSAVARAGAIGLARRINKLGDQLKPTAPSSTRFMPSTLSTTCWRCTGSDRSPLRSSSPSGRTQAGSEPRPRWRKSLGLHRFRRHQATQLDIGSAQLDIGSAVVVTASSTERSTRSC